MIAKNKKKTFKDLSFLLALHVPDFKYPIIVTASRHHHKTFSLKALLMYCLSLILVIQLSQIYVFSSNSSKTVLAVLF